MRQAAFEEEGPQLTSGSDGQARLRSIVVDRDEDSDSTRSAQLPSSSTGQATTPRGTAEPPTSGQPSTGQPPTGESPLEDLGTPFGDMPELQQPGELETDTMPLPQDNQTQLPDTTQPRTDDEQPFGTAPSEFQPRVPPRVVPAPQDVDVPTAPPAAVEADRERSEEACDESLENLRANTIDKLNLSISVAGTEGQDYPFECTVDQGTWHPGRAWPQTTYLWKASALCHKPLYFEDEHLERYGHTWPDPLQPFISGAHFFCTLPVLPYCMGVEPPMECIYALGHYRPGSCAPYLCDPIPISPRGALLQGGAVFGAGVLLP